ncbi:hypothetical protein JD844_004683 [Phrynosoma platyrhinos]|uniref:Sulfhydryl oxidase n=1 Tax=Phrynosoma platyrhinos TaxID=52577 RepID=A0ABQ7SDN8_PHRPL|nr:hypothetical protein JD844_004683 [Phrynosoma platyrhinos]
MGRGLCWTGPVSKAGGPLLRKAWKPEMASGGALSRRWWWPLALLALWAPGPGRAGLYQGGVDPVWVLEAGTVRAALLDSASAWLVQFYSFEVKEEWEPAIRVGVLDCGDEGNYETCKEYGIQYYPTFRSVYEAVHNWRKPAWPEEMFTLFDKKIQHYTAIIFESENSYVGREVILDLSQYENIVVTRALDFDTVFLEKLSITSVPSAYLIYPNGTHGLINILKPLRSFFSSYLKSLPGVRRKSSLQLSMPVRQNRKENVDVKEWKDYDKSKLYMADLESGLHYLLRVELATHKTLEGTELKTFKNVVTLFAKLFPGPQPMMKLLETLQVWLVSLPLDKIPYDAVLDLLNNKMRIAGLFLTSRIQWVGCQGSRPKLRGYTCSFWKLFHVLTVEAALRPKALLSTEKKIEYMGSWGLHVIPTHKVNCAVGFEDNPRVVLEIMQKYVRDFFGCRACAQHFEEMARESLDSVNTLDEAVLWLWEKHNVVNARLAVQWPTVDICPACHDETKGLSTWNKAQVLEFMKRHYGSNNILYTYTEDQNDLDAKEFQEDKDGNNDPASKKENQRNKDRNTHPEKLLDSKSRVLDKWIAKDSPVRDLGKKGMESAIEKEMEQAVSFLGIGFSNIDMSLCIVLYITSSLFLMIMYFFFRMRSKRWKVKYNRPYV